MEIPISDEACAQQTMVSSLFEGVKSSGDAATGDEQYAPDELLAKSRDLEDEAATVFDGKTEEAAAASAGTSTDAETLEARERVPAGEAKQEDTKESAKAGHDKADHVKPVAPKADSGKALDPKAERVRITNVPSGSLGWAPGMPRCIS